MQKIDIRGAFLKNITLISFYTTDTYKLYGDLLRYKVKGIERLEIKRKDEEKKLRLN